MEKQVKNTKNKTSSPTRRYDEEFKAGAVRLIVEQKRPAARVAKELGVTAETLRTWVKNYTSPPESEYMQLKAAQAEVKRLKRQNADHLETIEILKKAAAFFIKT